MNLQLHEIINLDYEINGYSTPGENDSKVEVTKGLLKQKTSLKVKVYLQRLNKIVKEEVDLYNAEKKKLFEKYGTEKDGAITLNKENIADFNNDHLELLTVEKKIDVQMIWSTDLNIESLSTIETEEVYPVFLKLIDK